MCVAEGQGDGEAAVPAEETAVVEEEASSDSNPKLKNTSKWTFSVSESVDDKGKCHSLPKPMVLESRDLGLKK